MSTPPLEVLVPGGRDPFADYSAGIPGPEDAGHPPVNFHAMAAATGGRFHRSVRTVPRDARFVLLLLPRHLPRAVLAARALTRAGRGSVLLSWKECGAHQIERQVRRPLARFWLRRTLARASAVVCPSPASLEFFRALPGVRNLLALPTPYPLDDPRWSHARPRADRDGVFVGTRDWRHPSRRHESAVGVALRAATRAGCRVTVVNVDGPAGRRRLEALAAGVPLRVVDGPLPYPAYLREMASHRLVLQRDRSGVPGQVAGDALLCGMPCLGGNGMVDAIAFADLPGAESPDPTVEACAHRLLVDDDAWNAAVRTARSRAVARLDFSAFRDAWRSAAASFADLTGPRGPA